MIVRIVPGTKIEFVPGVIARVAKGPVIGTAHGTAKEGLSIRAGRSMMLQKPRDLNEIFPVKAHTLSRGGRRSVVIKRNPEAVESSSLKGSITRSMRSRIVVS